MSTTLEQQADGWQKPEQPHLGTKARANLSSMYQWLVGYDPFEDDPRIAPQTVATTIAELLATPELMGQRFTE